MNNKGIPPPPISMKLCYICVCVRSLSPHLDTSYNTYYVARPLVKLYPIGGGRCRGPFVAPLYRIM